VQYNVKKNNKKLKKKDCSDMQILSENKSKTSWSKMKSEIGKANSKNHTPSEFMSTMWVT